MEAKQLTETQFAAAQDQIDVLARSTRKGTPEQKASFATLNAEWEAANALPQVTATQRDARRAAISTVATKHGLVAS